MTSYNGVIVGRALTTPLYADGWNRTTRAYAGVAAYAVNPWGGPVTPLYVDQVIVKKAVFGGVYACVVCPDGRPVEPLYADAWNRTTRAYAGAAAMPDPQPWRVPYGISPLEPR